MSIRFLICLTGLGLICQSLPAHEPHDAIDVVAVSPNFAKDQTVIAAFDNFTLNDGVYGILKSTDGGVSWSAIQNLPNNTATSALIFSPTYATDQTIFIAGPGGLWGSGNQGASWNVLKAGNMSSVAVSPIFSTDNTIFVVSGRSVFESTNRGHSWKTLAAPPGLSSSLTVIAVSPNFSSDNTLLLGSLSNGIYGSNNAGASWIPVTAGVNLKDIDAFTFSPNYTTDHTVFAGSYGSGVVVSNTGGSSWTVSASGLTDLNVTSLAVSNTYSQDSTVYAATATSGVFVSTSAGSSWTLGSIVPRQLSPQTTRHYRSIASAPGPSGTTLIYLVMWEGFWSSNDNAASWKYIDTIPTRMVRQINISPNYASDHTVYVSTYGSGNLWSTDGGATWKIKNTGMHVAYTDPSVLSPNFAVDQTAFNGNFDGLQKTTNAGLSWQLLAGGEAGPTYIRTIALAPNYNDTLSTNKTLLLGTRNGPVTCPSGVPMIHNGHQAAAGTAYTGLFVSTDGGVTWGNTSLTRPVSAGCWGILGSATSPAFATDKTAFAVSPDTGVYNSTDGGQNWTLLSAPTTAGTIVVTSPNYAQDQTVVVGGFYRGIYKSTDGGNTWTTFPQTANVRTLDIHMSPNYANDQTFYAATIQMGLVKITGSTVTQVTSFPDTFLSAVALSPNFATDRTIFAAGYHGLYKSIDGGTTWNYASEPARVEDTRNVSGPGQPGPDIIYNGSWALTTQYSSSTSSVMQTTVSGDTATFNFYGVAVDFVSYLGSGLGSVSITLDGVYQTTVSLGEASGVPNMYQQVVWQKQGLSCGMHGVTLTAVLGTGQTSVPVDAFDVTINGCEPAANRPH